MDDDSNFPELTTDRLRLREMTLDDVDWCLKHFSKPEIVEGIGFPAPKDKGSAREEFELYILRPWREKTGVYWGIELKDGPGLIGSAGFYKWNQAHRKAEIEYDLDPAHWGKGIMREALEAIIEYGFVEMDLNRITLLVISSNERSLRLVRRLGFLQEGVMRESAFFDGRFIDDVLFSLLKSEWRR